MVKENQLFLSKLLFTKMPSNSLLHFIANVINFEGFKATNYHFISENELLVVLENQSHLATCPHCQKTTDKIHQSHWYRVRDLPWSNFQIFLHVNRRQFRCKSCRKVFSEELSFVKKRRTYTKRLAAKVVKELLETDILNTAQRNGLTPAEIETLLKEADVASIFPKKLSNDTSMARGNLRLL